MIDGEEYEPTLWDRIGPTIYSIAVLIMNVAFIAAGLATVYLLYGVLTNQLADAQALPGAEQDRIRNVVTGAGKTLLYGLAVGTLCAAYITFGEEAAGYIILGTAAFIGFGIPSVAQTLGANIEPDMTKRALKAFTTASYLPASVGVLLVVKDVFLRLVSAVQHKPLQKEELTYGGEAEAERLPIRTSLFAKCWEGPFCREFVRTHCPIFQARKACWKERRGCYCEEDIVASAAAKVQGVTLEMAPDSKFNFSNPARPAGVTLGTMGGVGGATGGGGGGIFGPSSSAPPPRRVELSLAQKKERCRNCVIYNEHQREKYKILMPVVLIGGLAACAILSPLMRMGIGLIIDRMDDVVRRITFTASTNVNPGITKPDDGVAWVVVAAVSLMIVSKLMQTLEWACFKAKI